MLDWPRAELPLGDTVTLCYPFDTFEAAPEEVLSVVPILERAMRTVDPSVRSVSGEIVRNAVMRDFRGTTICVHPLALQLHVRLSCDVLPQDRTRRQSVLARGIVTAAQRPDLPPGHEPR